MDDSAVSCAHLSSFFSDPTPCAFRQFPESKDLCTQFLYQFPPKLPLGTVQGRGTMRYNILETKALAVHALGPGHLARKLFIEMCARDAGSVLRQPRVGACLPKVYGIC